MGIRGTGIHAIIAMSGLGVWLAPAVAQTAAVMAAAGPAVADQAAASLSGTTPAPVPQTSGIEGYLSQYWSMVAAAKAAQPEWSSPLVTTTSLLEERFRFDVSAQTAGNGANTTTLDGGKGLDLIVGPDQEIQIANPPYVLKSNADNGKGQLEGWNDWPVLRFKQRLASSPEDQGDYSLAVWVQIQLPTGQGKLTTHAVTFLPTLGGGKGFGDFVIQGTVGATLPTSSVEKLGDSVTGNLALQCRLIKVLWPQLEVNWTYYADGPRGGLSTVYLTPGLVVGRIPLTRELKLSVGVGYESAITPSYRSTPVATPGFNHATILSTRMSF